MDKYDKEFETYLRQFRLRQPGLPPELASVSRRRSMGWLLAAAVVVLAVGISAVLVRNSGSGAGPKATVESAGSPSLYRAGEAIEAGQAVRSNSAVGLLLALEDGSRIEMREQSELKLESAGDGTIVRLNEGSILVTAARQAARRFLHVQTRDAMVSVVGTVFLVSAEQSGTTVAVLEGEVHVQQGAEFRKLLPGDQMATNSKVRLNTVAEQISWSRSAAEYVALLQKPVTEAAPLTPDPVVSSQAGDVPSTKYCCIDYNDLDSAPSTRASNKRLPFSVQANYVRATGGEVRTLITVQFLNRDLALQDLGGVKRAMVHIDGTIDRVDGRSLRGFSQDVLQEFTSSTFAANLNEPVIFQDSRYLTPGKYKLHLTVEDKNSLNSQNTGVLDYVLDVPRIPEQALQASSMILAYSITGLPRGVGVEPFALGDKKVKPNITGAFRRDQSLNIWQEIYGLAVDPTTGKPSAAFELHISQNRQEIRNFTFYSAEWLSTVRAMVYTNGIPLANFTPGAYDVQLKVTDNLAKASFVSIGKFTVVGSSLQPEPTQITSGKQVFDRECTSCHSAEVTMRLGAFGTQNLVRDRERLSSDQAELAQLVMTGMTQQNPEVGIVQARISVQLQFEAAIRKSYSSLVLSHLSRFGGTISSAELPLLVEYALAETIRKAETQGPAGPVTPPAAPNDQDGKKEDPDITGARILNSACTTCHDLGAVVGRKEDKASWESITKRMIGYGAGLKDSEISTLADYLFRHYGSPPDDAGERILNSACTTCHDLGVVVGRKEDKRSWERIVNGMIGYGAGLKDSEFPVLVDYLFRHYGPPKEPVPGQGPAIQRRP